MTTPKQNMRRSRLASIAFASACLAPLAAWAQDAQQAGASFVDNFERIDPSRWYVSDGWNNGPHQNCTWSKKQVSIKDGALQLQFAQEKLGQRNYACAEIQTTKRYGYGTYEARYRTATGPGLNSAFFTYIGPTDKKPHDEIDFEVLGKNVGQVQVNQYISAKGGNEKLAPVTGGADQGFNDYAFIWEKDRLRYFVNGELVQDVTDPSKIPSNAQKIFFSLWGTDTLSGWMGKFAYGGAPATMQIKRVAFTAPGEKCLFPESITCKIN